MHSHTCRDPSAPATHARAHPRTHSAVLRERVLPERMLTSGTNVRLCPCAYKWTVERRVSHRLRPSGGAESKAAAMPQSWSPLCVLGLIALGSACYIQNCPRGGKRALPESGIRQCMSCGPGDRGRCFGPGICCGDGLGCLLGSAETARCAEENHLLTPCQAGGRPCGAEGGRCAAAGLCCDSDGCAADADCLADAEAPDVARGPAGGAPAELLLRLLHVATRGRPEY
ncbi:vasopressin-neurophysin 2-copeptin [Betta splendens]|uniref:Vasopressin-neurophysin 2-copeptin n=1 Tax=Betta splendens TaxID=158456 RepID=A0A6P7NDD6_BETSP|nr:vasopressin-neurophysin 2-copeptin [Betta splendens]